MASENRIMILLVVCVVERYALSLNQSTSLKQRLNLYHKGKQGSYNDTL